MFNLYAVNVIAGKWQICIIVICVTPVTCWSEVMLATPSQGVRALKHFVWCHRPRHHHNPVIISLHIHWPCEETCMGLQVLPDSLGNGFLPSIWEIMSETEVEQAEENLKDAVTPPALTQNCWAQLDPWPKFVDPLIKFVQPLQPTSFSCVHLREHINIDRCLCSSLCALKDAGASSELAHRWAGRGEGVIAGWAG